MLAKKIGKIKVLVIGGGAVGAYFGGRLAQTGVDVSVTCRSDYEKVKKDGFNIKSIAGDFIFKPSQVLHSSKEYIGKPDYLIVSLKVLPSINTISLIKDAIHSNTSIILIQNGIDIEQVVIDAFPNNEVISAIAYIGVMKIAPGEIIHQDYGRLTLGKYPNGLPKSGEIIKELFESKNVSCNIVNNIIYYRWLKLVWNIPYNHLSVLGDHATTEDIMKNPLSTQLVKDLMFEVAILAEKAGYKLPDNVIQENIDFTLKMQPYKTSMLIDYENKREMEIEAILGNTIKIADKLNIHIPNMKTIYPLMQLINRKNSSK